MGGKPVAAPSTGPVPGKGYTLQQLQAMGAKPVTGEKTFGLTLQQQHEQNAADAAIATPAAKAEADKANSLGGFAANTGRAIRDTVASSEVGLGKTIGSEINVLGGNTDKMAETEARMEANKVATLKLIRDKKAKGQDTTADERVYNDLVKQSGGVRKDIADTSADSQKDTSTVAGELAGTALDVLSAGTYGNAAKGAKTGALLTKADSVAAKKILPTVIPKGTAGLFTKEGAAAVAKGAGTGYAFDVTQGLQGQRGQDRTGIKAVIPGMGTVIGAAFPLLAHGTQSVKNAADVELKNKNIVDKRSQEIFNIENNYAGTRKNMAYSTDANAASRSRVASTDVLASAIDENGLIRTKGPGGAAEKYRQMTIDGTEGVVRRDLEREGASIDAKTVASKMRSNIEASSLRGEAKTAALDSVDKEVAGLKRNPDGKIDLTELHDAKINQTNGINYATEPHVKTKSKAIASAYKTLIEDHSSLPVKEVNGEIGKYLKDIDLIESLDGKRVKGGKLGKYFAHISGNIVGGIAGGAIGGPAGSAVGTVVGGELGSRIKGSILKNTLSGETGRVAPKSPILEEAVTRSKSPRLMLEAPKPGSPRSSVSSGPTIHLPARSQSTVDEAYRNRLRPETANQISAATPQITPRGVMPKSMAQSSIQFNPLDRGQVREPYMAPDKMPTIQMGAKPKEGLPSIQIGKKQSNAKLPAVIQSDKLPPPKVADKVAYGFAAGIEVKKDKDGKTHVTFNPEKALIGIAGTAAYQKIPKGLRGEVNDTLAILKTLKPSDFVRNGKLNMDIFGVVEDFFDKVKKGTVTKDDIRDAQEAHFMVKGRKEE